MCGERHRDAELHALSACVVEATIDFTAAEIEARYFELCVSLASEL
jgi:hypothetical protein